MPRSKKYILILGVCLLLSSLFTSQSKSSVDPHYFTTGIYQGTTFTLNTTFISSNEIDIGSQFTFNGQERPLIIKEGDYWIFEIILNTVDQIQYKIIFKRQDQSDLSPDQISISKDSIEWIGSNLLPSPFQTNNITLLNEQFGDNPSVQFVQRESNFTLSDATREDTYDIVTGILIHSKLYEVMTLDLVEVDLFKSVCTVTRECKLGYEFKDCSCVEIESPFYDFIRFLIEIVSLFFIISFALIIIIIIRFYRKGH